MSTTVTISTTEYVELLKKAAQRDAMVASSTYHFHDFLKLSREAAQHAANLGYWLDRTYWDALAKRYITNAHEHWHNLKQAEIELACPCDYCKTAVELINKSPEAMRRISEIQGYEQTASEVEKI